MNRGEFARGLFFSAIFMIPLLLPAPAPIGSPVPEQNTVETISPVTNSDNPDIDIILEQERSKTIQAQINASRSSNRFSVLLGRGAKWNDTGELIDTISGRYIWNDTRQSMTISYNYSTKPVSRRGIHRVQFYDRKSWAFAPSVRTSTRNANLTTKSEGVVVGPYVYFGDYYSNSVQADGQDIKFIVGKGSHLNTEWATESIQSTSSYVQFGTKPENISILAIPASPEKYSGLTIFSRLDQQSIVILGKVSEGKYGILSKTRSPLVISHEYVHTRQINWELGPKMTWLREATAHYYAIETLYRSNTISDEAYRTYWLMQQNGITRGAILTNQSTWGPRTEYSRGAFVLAELDRRIRDTTDGNASLQTVIQKASLDSYTSFQEFNSTIERVADEKTASWFAKHTKSSTVPENAQSSEHPGLEVTIWGFYTVISRLPVWGRLLTVLLLGFVVSACLEQIFEKLKGMRGE